MPHSLFEDFKEPGFHSSVLSTYSVDPAFYDAGLQLRLRSFGCHNNLLIADGAMLDDALDAMPDAFSSAGRKYLVAPVISQACFHPKLALRYGKAKARLIIGSANVTAAGWSGNLELVSALSWQARSEDADAAIRLALIVRAHRWLTGMLPTGDDANLAYKLELLRSLSPWIEQPELAGSGPFQFSDGSEIDLLLSDPSSASGLADRMLEQIDEPIERLSVISPYWDDRLGALKRLYVEAGEPDLRVFLARNDSNPSRSSTFPVAALDGLSPVFHPVDPVSESGTRFLHAKVFVFHGRAHDFLFFGSANCTVAALGLPSTPGANHECLAYRKLPRGSVKQMLGLSYEARIPIESIATPPAKSKVQPSAPAFAPGSVQRRGYRLVWIPATGGPTSAVAIRVGGQLFPLVRGVGGIWSAEIGAAGLDGNVARITSEDGQLSRPTIIASPDELMRFAPFPVADSLRRKLDAVLIGDADLIGLARDIHLLLSDDDIVTPSLERIRQAGGRTSSPKVAGRDFATPEEFREALNLRASMKSAGLAHADHPALQALLQIVLRGIAGFESLEHVDAAAAASAKGLDLGEDQDDAGEADDAAVPSRSEPTPAPPQAVSLNEFERNQGALWRGVDRFGAFLDRAKAVHAELDLNFVTRSLFMLYLMLHGCTKTYQVEGGGEEVLIPFGGRPGEDFHDSFVFRAAQAILAIWGPDFRRSLMGRLRFTADSDVLPVQITTLTVISRWVLAAILVEVRSDKTQKSLRAVLEGQVPRLFIATRVFPDLDLDETFRIIRQIEQNIGMEAEQSAQIEMIFREMTTAV